MRFNKMSKSLDLGCHKNIRNTFNADEAYGLDIIDTGVENLFVSDIILDGIPCDSNYFDYVTAYDFLEHIPRLLYIDGKRLNPFINAMNEIWRVLKPGGIFYAVTPSFPHPESFQDPTHVNFISEQTYKYFTAGCNEYEHLGKDYGFNGMFYLLEQKWIDSHDLEWTMKAIK